MRKERRKGEGRKESGEGEGRNKNKQKQRYDEIPLPCPAYHRTGRKWTHGSITHNGLREIRGEGGGSGPESQLPKSLPSSFPDFLSHSRMAGVAKVWQKNAHVQGKKAGVQAKCPQLKNYCKGGVGEGGMWACWGPTQNPPLGVGIQKGKKG